MFSQRKTDDLFSHPLEHADLFLLSYRLATTHPSLPLPTSRLSSVLYKFGHKNLFSRVSPPWMVSPGAVRSPSDATGTICIGVAGFVCDLRHNGPRKRRRLPLSVYAFISMFPTCQSHCAISTLLTTITSNVRLGLFINLFASDLGLFHCR